MFTNDEQKLIHILLSKATWGSKEAGLNAIANSIMVKIEAEQKKVAEADKVIQLAD